MEPSETDRGQRWLSNFDAADKQTARLLLDSLELIGQDKFKSELQQLVQHLAKRISTPIAIVPVRELDPRQKYYAAGRNAKPRLLLQTSFPGSEAIVANIAGGLRREKENKGPFVSTPSLKNMRMARCRSIVLLDDFLGSGDRIVKFYQGYRHHATLASWKSYHLIEYHVAAYAMTRKAHDRLSRVFGKSRVHTVIICPTFANQKWSDAEHLRVEALCRSYADSSGSALGYESTRALIAFSHTAPNNLPNILWQRQGPHGFWESFFIEKSIPQDLLPLFEEPSSHEARLQASLHRLGQKRLATGRWPQEASRDLQSILLFLAALARRPRDESMVIELTGLASFELEKITEMCRGWGLIGNDNLRLTDAGRAELEHAKSVALPSNEIVLKGSDEPYYPRSLRVGR